MKKVPELPSYDDDMTPEQYEAIRNFMNQFDMSEFIEDTPEYTTGSDIFCQGYNDYLSNKYDVSYLGTEKYEEYHSGRKNAKDNMIKEGYYLDGKE